MKIVGQSTLANGTPYIHLGYTAATYTQPQMKLLGGGLVAVLLGAAMAFRLVSGKTKSESSALILVRRKSRKFLLGGMALIIAGCICVVLAVTYGEELPSNPELDTHGRGYELLREVAELREQGKPVPSDIALLGRSHRAPYDGWARHDAWGNLMRLVKKTDADGSDVYSVLSAGADGKFDTDDDVHISRDTGGEQ
jgi:hypothetical protein